MSITKQHNFQDKEEAIKRAKTDLKYIMKQMSMNPEQLMQQKDQITQEKEKASQLLFMTLDTKVRHLDESVSRLANKNDVTKEIHQKLSVIKKLWTGSCGQLSSELSNQIDKILIAKRNVQKVVSILADYENLADELNELSSRLDDNDTSELADVYRKLKRYVYLRQKLIEKIQRQGGADSEMNLAKIQQQFEAVSQIQQKFNTKIFSIIESNFSLARERPVDLVRVMRIVKNEEVANRAAEKATQDQDPKRKTVVIASESEGEDEEDLYEEKMKILTTQKTTKPEQQIKQDQKSESLQSICEMKLREAVTKRANLAFQDIPQFMKTREDLRVVLDQSELLFVELKYVKTEIAKCFPPDFPVFEIYRVIYVQQICQRFMQKRGDDDLLLQIVTDEPTVVIWLNNFVQTVNEAMDDMQFNDDQKYDMQTLLYNWTQYQPKYSEHMRGKIKAWFDNVYEQYTKQEMENVTKYIDKKGKLTKLTDTLGDINSYMVGFAESLHESQRGERLFELLRMLVEVGPIEFIQVLLSKCREESSENSSSLLSFYGMIIRANEIDAMVKKVIPEFQQKCLDIQSDQMASRTTNFFSQQTVVLEEAQKEVHAYICLFILRKQIQTEYMCDIFTKSWIQKNAEENQSETPIQGALKMLQAYTNDVQNFIVNERSKEKIFNVAFGLFADSYVERLVIALYKFLGTKQPIKGVELQQVIYPALVQNTKILTLDFMQSDLSVISDSMQIDIDQIKAYCKTSLQPIALKLSDQKKMQLQRLLVYFDRIDDGIFTELPLVFGQPTEGYPKLLDTIAEVRSKHLQTALSQLQNKRIPEKLKKQKQTKTQK